MGDELTDPRYRAAFVAGIRAAISVYDSFRHEFRTHGPADDLLAHLGTRFHALLMRARGGNDGSDVRGDAQPASGSQMQPMPSDGASDFLD